MIDLDYDAMKIAMEKDLANVESESESSGRAKARSAGGLGNKRIHKKKRTADAH